MKQTQKIIHDEQVEVIDDSALLFENSNVIDRSLVDDYAISDIDDTSVQLFEDHFVIKWSSFKVRSATHKTTTMYIYKSGQWTTTTTVKTGSKHSKPKITIYIRFIHARTRAVIPPGQSRTEWQSSNRRDGYREIWSGNFGKREEKTYNRSGQSNYLRDNYNIIKTHGIGYIRMVWERRN